MHTLVSVLDRPMSSTRAEPKLLRYVPGEPRRWPLKTLLEFCKVCCGHIDTETFVSFGVRLYRQAIPANTQSTDFH
jgi:hypothetical protein